MTDLLFQPDLISSDKLYTDIRDCTDNDYIVFIKQRLESLWQQYKPYADPHFKKIFAEDLHSRIWEMCLTCVLLEHHLPVKRKTRADGPDILLEQDNSNILIEAVAPTPGEEGNPDKVPELKIGVVQRVPDEQIILRYRSAIEEKRVKCLKYLEQKMISPTDAYIIAVNSCKIDNAGAELNPPRIVKALFPIGYPQITLDKRTLKVIGEGYEHRSSLRKATGAEISTKIFLDSDYACISGVLYSRTGVRNMPGIMGDDFVFVHNPLAINPVPRKFIPCAQEYVACEKAECWHIERL